ncbi:hypothetical protein PRUPE_5G070700 [Prunus persica]|uniref:Uncharacterized protein n=1 Tax=Prunus persica TaxID=3760 RepID=M5WS97_PRUPE|nr:hypothetical protein PRUPE_5G070700 [Prunus persica]
MRSFVLPNDRRCFNKTGVSELRRNCSSQLHILVFLSPTESTRKEAVLWTNCRGVKLISEFTEPRKNSLGNLPWQESWPNTFISHHPAIGSDHNSLVLETTMYHKNHRRQFKFEAYWANEVEAKQIIEKGWEKQVHGSWIHKWKAKLQLCTTLLKKWSREKFSNNKKRMEALHVKLNEKQLRIKGDDGHWHVGEPAVRRVFEEHFKKLFTSEAQSINGDILDCVDSVISQTTNDNLLQAITMEEIKEAAMQMGGLKAPGPDGYQGIFFHKYWDTIYDEVRGITEDFFLKNQSLGALNITNLVLIPKIPNPEGVSHFRLISLCNFSFKIVSKVMANRLKVFLPQIISPAQNAFAYDRVEWHFLESVMIKMGFYVRWVNLVMNLVHTVPFSLVLNGVQGNTFTPTRGIRQGDPLSPYLFLIVSEVLSLMIKKACEANHLQGLKFGRSGPTLSHLLFADDALFFIRANTQNCRNMRLLLDGYCRASGQQINFGKSSLFFSPNTPASIRTQLGAILGMTMVDDPGKYLGLPTMWGRSKKEALQFVKEKLLRKLSRWKQSLLSQAGREVLIKAIVQAVPNYPMRVFLFPKTFCLMRPLLSTEEAFAIQRIPIGSSSEVDCLVWPDEKNGKYSVKSGYHNIHTHHHRSSVRRPSSSMSKDQRAWKLIWHADVTPKICHFFWRALNGHVAVSSVLYKKKLRNSPLCPIFNDHEETIEHMLLLCPWVEPVWFEGLTYRVDRQQISSLHTWRREAECQIAYTCWNIWKTRNMVVFDNFTPQPQQTLKAIFD